MTVKDILGPDGVLAQHLPEYEVRPGQVKMAQMVEATLRLKKQLMVEAPTGVGKCVHADAQVPLASGEIVSGRELCKRWSNGEEIELVSLDAKGKLRFARPLDVVWSGVKKGRSVETASGRQTWTSLEHLWFSERGEVTIDELCIGDLISTPRQLLAEQSAELHSAIIDFLAFMVCDGSSGPRQTPSYTKQDKDTMDLFTKTARKLGADVRHDGVAAFVRDPQRPDGSGSVGRAKNTFNVMLESYGLFGVKSPRRTIPEVIFTLGKEDLCRFLGRMIIGDGSVEKLVVSYGSRSKLLVYQVQHLLLRIGVMSNVRKKYVKYKGEMLPNWELYISSAANIILLNGLIGKWFVGKKKIRLKRLVADMQTKKPNPNVDVVPKYYWDLLETERERLGISKTRFFDKSWWNKKLGRRISRPKFQKWALNSNNQELIDDSVNDVLWDAVKEMGPIEERESFDVIMAPEGSGWECSFVADDFFMHNSFAYAIPAIEHAVSNGRKAIIATANIALQEQLHYKDLPFLQKHLGIQFTHTLLKGRGNFICESKWEEQRERPEMAKYHHWVTTTRTGDKSELDFDTRDSWFKISSTGSECVGPKCHHRNVCWAQRIKQQAYRADILVVNYHLLFAHWESGNVLPEHNVLICDEAHAMADIARSAAGDKLSVNSLKWLASQVNAYVPSALNWKVAETVMAEVAHFLGKKPFSQRTYNEGDLDFDIITNELEKARTKLLQFSTFADEHDEAKYTKTCETLANTILRTRAFQRGCTDFRVCWAEMQTKDLGLVQYSPISVASYISGHMPRTAVLTSATLTTGGKFDFVKDELGMHKAVERRIPYAFDYEEQGVLYVPRIKVKPNDKEFMAHVVAEMKELIPHVPGGVLVLCTSVKAMRQYTEDLRACGWSRPVMVQGDSSRRLLMEKMKAEPGSVLIATKSFFEGIDIPGDALQCVIIDKLPFPVPSDPVIQAIQDKIKEDTGENGWFKYSLPLCGMTMAQASGRLLRRSTDRGVVACFDSRLRTAGYKGFIRQSMPPFTRRTRRADVIEFLSESC